MKEYCVVTIDQAGADVDFYDTFTEAFTHAQNSVPQGFGSLPEIARLHDDGSYHSTHLLEPDYQKFEDWRNGELNG